MPKFSESPPLRKNCNLLAGIHLVTSKKKLKCNGDPSEILPRIPMSALILYKLASFPGSILPKKILHEDSCQEICPHRDPAKKKISP